MQHLRILCGEVGDLNEVVEDLELPQLAMVSWSSKQAWRLNGLSCWVLRSVAVLEICGCEEIPRCMKARSNQLSKGLFLLRYGKDVYATMF